MDNHFPEEIVPQPPAEGIQTRPSVFDAPALQPLPALDLEELGRVSGVAIL